MVDVALDTEDLVAARDAALVPVQQAIDVLADAVRSPTFAVSSVFVERLRRAFVHLLSVRDELK